MTRLHTFAGALVLAGLGLPAPQMGSPHRAAAEPSPASFSSACTTPIEIDALPYEITEPGYYCVTADLELGVPDEHGIRVSVSRVVIDLNGHELDGGASGQVAILGAATGDVTVRNGLLRDWENGIRLGSQCTVEHVQVRTVAEVGIDVSSGARVRYCYVLAAAGAGIDVFNRSIVEDCEVQGGGRGISGQLAEVRRCGISATDGDGIGLAGPSLVDSCLVDSVGGVGVTLGPGSRVVATSVRSPVGDGIRLGQSGVIDRCVVRGSTGTSVQVPSNGLMIDSSVSGGVRGVLAGSNSRIERCVVEGSSGEGITTEAPFGSTEYVVVADTTVSGHAGDGIRLSHGSQVLRCLVSGNALAGIRALGDGNRIQDNQVVDNGTGIALEGIDNLTVGNGAFGNGTDAVVPFNNTTGPFLKDQWWIQARHPWSNFSLDF